MAKMLPNADPVHKISIVAADVAGSYPPAAIEDRYLMTSAQFRDMLATLLGGRTAENLIFSETTTGASDDIKRATDLARRMVTDFGMSDKLGPRTFGDKQSWCSSAGKSQSRKTMVIKSPTLSTTRWTGLIREANDTAVRILTENKDKLAKLGPGVDFQRDPRG